MLITDLIDQLQQELEFHGDIEVKVSSKIKAPTTLVYFEYNDDESEAWITIEGAT